MKFLTGMILSLSLIASLTVFAAPIPTSVASSAAEAAGDVIGVEPTASLNAEVTGTKLTGEEIYGGEFNSDSDEPKWNNNNKTDYLFMKKNNDVDLYVGYKLASPKVLTQVIVYPDARSETADQIKVAYERIKGATVEGSTDGVNWEILGTVTSKAKTLIDNKKASSRGLVFNIVGNKEFSYVRFCMRKDVPDRADYFSFSEVEFYGSEKAEQKLVTDSLLEGARYTTGGYTAVWHDGSYTSGSGSERVFFSNNDSEAYAGFDYGAHRVVPTKVVLVPSVDKSTSYSRIKNSVIQGRTESGNWENILALDFSSYKSALDNGELKVITFEIDAKSKEYSALRIFREKGSADFLCFVDLAFYGYISSETEGLTGTPIYSHSETTTYYKGTPATVFDGDVDSYLMIATNDGQAAEDIWAGYDFGEDNAVIITDVGYYGFNEAKTPERVRGQIFQGSNDKETWNDLAVIKVGTKGEYTYFDVFDDTPYRYVRLIDKNGTNDKSTSASGSFFTQAEVEFYGHYAKNLTVTFNGGVGSSDTTKVEVLETETIDISKYKLDNTADYEFIGWTDEAGCTVEGTVKVTTNMVLTAQWKYIGVAPLSFNENSIRVDDPSGIRFKSAVTTAVKTDEKTTEYGYIVTRQSLLGSYDAKEVLKFDNNVVRYVSGVSYSKNPVKDIIYGKDDTYCYFTAVVHGIKEDAASLKENIVVRPYIKYNNETIYGTPMFRSIYDVANAMRKNDYAGLNAHEKEYVEGILKICDAEQ